MAFSPVRLTWMVYAVPRNRRMTVYEDTESGLETGSAYLCFSDVDWWPGVSLESSTLVNTPVNGAGTYTFYWNLKDWEDVEGIVVWYIDIIGAARDTHLTSLKITADGKTVPVTFSKVLTGDLEGKGNYRIEIYNIYGNTKNNAPVNTGLTFSEELQVTFTLASGAGNTVQEEAETEEFNGEGFKTTMVFNDADWWPQGSITTGVTGPGTYTLSWDLESWETAEGVVTFYIDIFDAYAALGHLDLTELTILVDGQPIEVDMSKVLYGDLEGYGHYRIEIYNEYGATKLDPPIDIENLVIDENLTVIFTLAEPVPEEEPEEGENLEVTEDAPETESPAVPEETEEDTGFALVPVIVWTLVLLAAVIVILLLWRKKKAAEEKAEV